MNNVFAICRDIFCCIELLNVQVSDTRKAEQGYKRW
jgi:hypothetical protein